MTVTNLVTPEDAGKILSVCTRSVRNYVLQGKLRGIWLSTNTLRVVAEDLQRLIDSSTTRPMPSTFKVSADSEISLAENESDKQTTSGVQPVEVPVASAVEIPVTSVASVVGRKLTDSEAASIWGAR